MYNKNENQYVLLINDNNEFIHKVEKLYAHKMNLKHLAFSIFIYNDNAELLIQKRNRNKYHFGGLWSNTCCSHPVSINVCQEAQERLFFEMGINAELYHLFSFSYNVDYGGGLYENEHDYVFIGKYNCEPIPNPIEVEDYKWIDYDKLLRDIVCNQDKYTYWFKLSVNNVIENLRGR